MGRLDGLRKLITQRNQFLRKTNGTRFCNRAVSPDNLPIFLGQDFQCTKPTSRPIRDFLAFFCTYSQGLSRRDRHPGLPTNSPFRGGGRSIIVSSGNEVRVQCQYGFV